MNLFVILSSMGEDTTLNPTATDQAEAYRESLLKYKTILTAQLFLRIFEHISLLSKYTQRVWTSSEFNGWLRVLKKA